MKRVFTAILFMAASCGGSAQKISSGLKAGVNITNFTGGNFQNADKKALVGFHAGLFFNFRLGAVSLQPEVLVSTAGAKYENADSSFKLTYLAVPVMLRYRTTAGVYFEIGPQVGFKLRENVSNQTVADLAKNLDFSGAVGLGFQTKKGLGIYGRYVAGLSKVGDFLATSTVDPDFKNSIIQAGISIPLSK